jgi:hypothetical protein
MANIAAAILRNPAECRPQSLGRRALVSES